MDGILPRCFVASVSPASKSGSGNTLSSTMARDGAQGKMSQSSSDEDALAERKHVQQRHHVGPTFARRGPGPSFSCVDDQCRAHPCQAIAGARLGCQASIRAFAHARRVFLVALLALPSGVDDADTGRRSPCPREPLPSAEIHDPLIRRPGFA